MSDNPYQPPATAKFADSLPVAVEAAAATQPSVTVFRGMLLLDGALVVAGIVASFTLSAFLPPELQVYAESDEMPSLGSTAVTATVAAMALFVVLFMLIGWLGMFFFWRPSRWLFLLAHLLILPLMALFGPSVMHGIEYALDAASHVLGGVILGLAFFTPLGARFTRGRSRV